MCWGFSCSFEWWWLWWMGEFSCNSRRSFLVCFMHHAALALALALAAAALAAAALALAAAAAVLALAAAAALVPGRWRARHANIQSCWSLFGLPQTAL